VEYGEMGGLMCNIYVYIYTEGCELLPFQISNFEIKTQKERREIARKRELGNGGLKRR